MLGSTSKAKRSVPAAWALIGTLGGIVLGGIVTYVNDHQKLVEAKIADQKTIEINAFLKSSQDMYPLVADEVGRLEISSAQGSPESRALIKNLQVQYSSLESAASYLPSAKRTSAIAYQSDLVSLLRQAKSINGPLEAKPFVDALHDAIIHRCEVTSGLRASAGLPKGIDPACDVTASRA